MHCVRYSYKQHNSQQMHTKLLKILHNICNSYTLQRQGSIFGESKIQSKYLHNISGVTIMEYYKLCSQQLRNFTILIL